MTVLTAVVTFVTACGAAFATHPRPGVLRPERSQPAPVFGVDLIYYSSPPFVLINAFQNKARGDEFAAALRDMAGISAVRFSSHGIYSHRGPARSLELERETKLPNRIPWFPIERVAELVRDHDLHIVVGVNPEDGPAAAADIVERFRGVGALDNVIAVELGNEPHLSERPWQPEEYAIAAAAIIQALEPTGVRFALPLTLGKETKTPTGISDDDYTRRELAALDARVPLRDRDDVYGVVHLYARGVDPRTIDALDALVHPVAPRMRYLITEFNIRSTLADNQHLTTPYGLEFVKRTSRLVADPEIAGLFVHGVPYHSLLYWGNGNGLVTVSHLGDPRLSDAEKSRGWHFTPAGEITALFARDLWHGEILAFADEGDVQRWIVRLPDGELRAGLLNCSDDPIRRDFELERGTVTIAVGPRSAAVCSAAGEVGRVELTRGW